MPRFSWNWSKREYPSKASCRISKVHHSPTRPSVADSGHSRSSSLIFRATRGTSHVTAIFEATRFYLSSYTRLTVGGVVMSQAAASATGSLPPVISEYLAASDRGDDEAVVRCFAEDAVVVDEGREWQGTAAIRRWRATVATAYQYTVQVTGAESLGEADGAERHDVHVHLEGNFPGGQVDLTDRFAVRGGQIASLEIVPARARR